MASSLQQGINAAKAGQMGQALTFLKDAIIEEPRNADVWVWIAAIIDDLDKQEVFLEKALQIDPDNVPAQRGLAYLQKRKRYEASVQDDHLSDHTSPISPFPASQRHKQRDRVSGWSKLDLAEVNEIASVSKAEATDELESGGFFHNLPKLAPIEIFLLGVIVVVFCFIGLLAASAIFNFSLPLEFLIADRPRLTTEPPYPGVFLYENDYFFDIQLHEGVPAYDVGIPTSFEVDPVIVLWQTEASPDQIFLIYEIGEYIPFKQYQGKGNAVLIQPERDLQPGLYCLQHPQNTQTSKDALYWCFKVILPEPEG